jgi:hypothetical protein
MKDTMVLRLGRRVLIEDVVPGYIVRPQGAIV